MNQQMASFDPSCLLWAPKCLGSSRLLCLLASLFCLGVCIGFVLLSPVVFCSHFLLLCTLTPSHPSLSWTPLKWEQKEMKEGLPVGGRKDIWLPPDSMLFRSPPTLVRALTPPPPPVGLLINDMGPVQDELTVLCMRVYEQQTVGVNTAKPSFIHNTYYWFFSN